MPAAFLVRIALLAAFMLPSAAVAQGVDATHINGRLNELQRALVALSAQLEQLKAQDQHLQQRLGKMQTSIGQRLERLEKAPATKPVRRPGRSKQ